MPKLERMARNMADTRLLPEARPYRSGPKGAEEAVLLLHGFTGNPSELSAVGETLADAGYACLAPRYPGHGTSRADFLASGAEDWLRRALDAYLDLASEYRKVHVLGHSMGGLIATIVASAFKAEKLVLLAPAFTFADSGVALSPFIAPFLPVIHRGRPNREIDAARRRLFDDYWADDLVAGAVQLGRLARFARRELAGLGSKLLVVVGTRDEVIPPSVAGYVERKATAAKTFEARRIAGAGHLFPFDEASGEACAIVREWMSRA